MMSHTCRSGRSPLSLTCLDSLHFEVVWLLFILEIALDILPLTIVVSILILKIEYVFEFLVRAQIDIGQGYIGLR